MQGDDEFRLLLFFCNFKSLHLILHEVPYKAKELFLFWKKKSLLESSLFLFINQEL